MSVLNDPVVAHYHYEPMHMQSGDPDKNGVLEMSFVRQGDRSVLVHLHHKTPLLAPHAPYWDKNLPDLSSVYMIATSGGVLQGDRLELSIAMCAHAMVTSGSSQIRAPKPLTSRVARLIAANQRAE